MKSYLTMLVGLLLPLFAITQVAPEWIAVFNGPMGMSDIGKSIAVDLSGNVYTGGISVNSISNTTDYVLAKYSSSGVIQWSQNYNGQGNWDDNLTAICTDAGGNIYVTGGSDEGPTSVDYTTIRYNSSGGVVWKSSYAGLGMDNDDVASSITVDASENVYVTGASAGVASFMWADYATIKYNQYGDTLWTARLGGSGNDRATAIAVDDAGFVYVTGYVDGGAQHYNYGTVKYTPDGDTVWVRVYNGPGNDDDLATAIGLDETGNVFVTGQSWGIYDDYATVKYNPDGVQLWVARYNGPVNSYDKACSLAVDVTGNVYVTGSSGGTGINYDYATVKYSPAGSELWVARYNGPDNYNDYAVDMAMDPQGGICVTGYSENAPSPYISTRDFLTVKYNSDGQEQWFHRYNGAGNYHDEATAITSDQTGNFYVTGKSTYYQATNGSDMVTIKFSTTTPVDDNPVTNNTFFITPNPSSGTFALTTDRSLTKIEVLNLSGEQVYSLAPEGVSVKSTDMDLSFLKKGVYLIKVLTDRDCQIGKLILR